MHTDIQSIADQIRFQTKLTGVGVGISIPGRSDELAVSGSRRRKGVIPLTVNDKWHIGSVSKSFTATLVAKLFESDYPMLDCPVVKLLPDIEVHESWRDTTLYHLLTSTSGLPRDFPLKFLRLKEEDPLELIRLRRELISVAVSKPAKSKGGERFVYSNLGYTLLGYVAEVHTGQPFEALMQEHVLAPLELHSAGFGPPMGAHPDDEPIGHSVVFGYRIGMDPFKRVADLPAVIAPAGRLHMNMADLLRYGRYHLGAGEHCDSLLSAATRKLLHKPFLESYACGWVARDTIRGNGEMVWHNGSNKFWYTLLVLVPDKDIALTFVTNDGAIRKAEAAFFKVAKELLANY